MGANMTALATIIHRACGALNTRRGAAIALALLVTAHIALNLIWLRLDNHVIRIDEEFHAMGAQNYYFAISNPATPSLAERWAAVKAIESPYPPMLHLLGAGLALIVGYSPDAVAFSGTLCFALLIIGVYLLARQVLARPDALFAATVCGFIPVLFAGARYVALENLIAVLVIWGLYFLLRSHGFRRLPAVFAFGLVNGMVILTKPNGFVYYLLPALFIFGAAFWQAIRARAPHNVARLLRNGILCVAVTLLVALPWYAANWATFSQYWMNEHKGGRTPFAFAQVDGPGRSVVSSTPITELANVKATARPATPPPSRRWDFGPLNTLRTREWGAYALHMVNNGAFLPLFLLGCAGLLAGFWRYRRNRAFWMLIAWFVGSYVLNTLLFRFINARYAMPFIPALAIGTAMLFALVPQTWLRRSAGGLLLFLLAVQYTNISFLGNPRLNSWLPYFTDNYRVTRARDAGLVLTKSEVITGTYCFRAPVPGENYVDRAFRAMRDNPTAKDQPASTPQPYLLLESENNFGGFGFLRRTFAPEPNPLLRADLRGNPAHQRSFVHAGRFMQPKEVVAASDEAASIVVVMSQTNDTLAWGPNHPYCFEVLQEAPFAVVDYFYTPRFGLLPPAIIAVLQRRAQTLLPGTHDLFALYDAPELNGLSDADAQAVRAVNETLLIGGTPPVPLGDTIAVVGFAVRRCSEFLVQARVAMRCTAPIKKTHEFVFEFSGFPSGPVAYPMDPYTPTPSWVVGQIYVVDCYLQVPPGNLDTTLRILDAPGSGTGLSLKLSGKTI